MCAIHIMYLSVNKMQEFLLKMSKLLHQSFFRTLLSPTFMDQTLDNPQTFLLSCYRKYDALFYIHKIEIFFLHNFGIRFTIHSQKKINEFKYMFKIMVPWSWSYRDSPVSCIFTHIKKRIKREVKWINYGSRNFHVPGGPSDPPPPTSSRSAHELHWKVYN